MKQLGQLLFYSKTKQFLEKLDVEQLALAGCDFTNPYFAPTRIGIPIEEQDIRFDYDFKRLGEIERVLKGIDRKQALQAIFHAVCRDARSHTERHLAVHRFLSRCAIHNRIQPVYPDKTLVTDPLVLIHLHEMRCGHVARVAVDLFESVGYQGRLAHLGSHIIAEIYYDEAWHYFDADLFGHYEVVRNDDGTIPSLVELSQQPFRIDAPASRFSLNYKGEPKTNSLLYPSWNYFSQEAYVGRKRLYTQKISKRSILPFTDRYYGWRKTVRIEDKDRQLHDFPKYYQPGVPIFQSIGFAQHNGDKCYDVQLEWHPSKDKDNDVLGYKVFLSRQSRGWNYHRLKDHRTISPFQDHIKGWHPEMYDKMYQEPPHDVACLETNETGIRFTLPEDETYFVTVMPFDAHGKSVGKTLYVMSSELKINAAQARS